jgi:hypothetical protein
MNVSKRTKLSLSQFLDLFNTSLVETLLEKHNISCRNHYKGNSQTILKADTDSIAGLFDEIVNTNGCLKYEISPKYLFDERWNDLKSCLLLDGFRVENSKISSIEPIIEGNRPIEDDLTKEIQSSILAESQAVIIQINLSAQDFLKSVPDYNGCLSHARIALETLIRGVAKSRGYQNNNENKAWGESLSFLKTDGFLTKKQEETIASVYTFVSDGSHIPIGFTEKEYARFGRNLVTSICYFISKLLTGTHTA